jgi:hypothetical protein
MSAKSFFGYTYEFAQAKPLTATWDLTALQRHTDVRSESQHDQVPVPVPAPVGPGSIAQESLDLIMSMPSTLMLGHGIAPTPLHPHNFP